MFTETILPDTLRAIQLIAGTPEIKEAYLAEGTALALQIGHRVSVDLDLFTQVEFNEAQLSARLASLPEFAQGGTARWTVWGNIGKTRVSVFYYSHPLLEKTLPFEGIWLASLADIAAMKIHAIEGRGTKRDFIDVYFLSRKYTLEKMLGLYREKYGVLEDHLYTVLRSLDYFEDAEQEVAMPHMLMKADWEEAKGYFRQETRLILKKRLRT